MNLLLAIPNDVHARFDLGVYISCTIAIYLSTVYSDEDRRYQLLHHQLYMASTETVQGFRIAALDANIFVQSLFKHGQYPCPDMMSTFGQQLLYRAFQWIHLPHYMASIKKDCSTTWIQLFDLLMTRPPSDGTAIDVTDDACAHRLLALGAAERSMRTLYPQLPSDPALLSDFLHESATARSLFEPAVASDSYGIQLAQAAGCLVAELQDEASGAITVDTIMSQSDLLFILHAGGVYQPDASANRLFASNLFPVHINKQQFMLTCPQLITMSLELFLFPLPEITKNRSNRTWMGYIESMRQYATMNAHRAAKLAAFHQAPVFRQSFAIQHSMFDMRRPTRATAPMKQSDFIRTAGKDMVSKFRALTTTAPSGTNYSGRRTTINYNHCNASLRSSSNAYSAADYDVASTSY